MTKKILFAGTPEIAVPTLRALCSNFDVVGVLTSVDKAVGRSSQLVPSPVKVAAIELGIPVLQYESLKTEAREAVSGLGANILVSFAYGKIFGPKFLRLFEGSYNIHPSALPLMRGPSPIQETLLSGLKKCTISFQNLGEKMDEGEVWDTLEFDLSGKETDQSLNEIVGKKAGPFAVETLENIFEENLVCKAQEGEVTYCKMIQKEDGVLDFTSTAFENHCRIRSFYPWPKAWTKVNGKDIAITGVWGGFEELEDEPLLENPICGKVMAFRKDRGLGIACSDKILWVTGLQLPGKKELDYKAFVNGNRWILEGTFDTYEG